MALDKEGFEFFLKKFIFAECLHMGTRQRPLKKILCRAPCQGHSAKYFPKKNLCRVSDLGHSAKNFFKKNLLCRVPNSKHSAKKDVAEHRYAGQPMPSATRLSRAWHSTKKSFAECPFLPSALPSARHSAKKVFVECPIFDTRQSSLHSAKIPFPVVTLLSKQFLLVPAPEV